MGEVLINLTEDVELWYTGAGKNHGWILTVEDDVLIRMGSPVGHGKGQWKRRRRLRHRGGPDART